MLVSARRTLALAAAAATATASTLVWAPAAQAKGSVTDYGFSGRAYGTTVKTGQVGVASGRTAQSYLACTRRTGIRKTNALAAIDGEPGVAVEGVHNRTRSFKTRKKVGTQSRSRVADLVLGDPDGVHISVEGLRTTANAFALKRSGKLRARSVSKAADIGGHTGTPLDDVLGQVGAGLDDLLAALREEGGSMPIPGLGVISVGGTRNVVKKGKAVSQASALRATLYGPDGTANTSDDVKVIAAKSRATIKRDLVSGVFRGKAVPARATALGDLVKVGRVIDKPLPCEGTHGKVQTQAVADADLFEAGAIELGAVSGKAWGVQRRNGVAKGWTRAAVADVVLGGGAIKVEGIVGRALAKQNKRGKVVRRHIRGSRIGSLTINGEPRAIPDPGRALEVPGVAKLQFFVKKRSKRGIHVTALRVTLLDGTGAVVNLGAGAIKVEGIVGRALVKQNKRGKVVRRSIRGSQIGSLTVNDRKQAIPDPGQAIEVPGVAKLQFFVKKRSKRGIHVTALRVTLLDGTGAVVNLGEARTHIKRS